MMEQTQGILRDLGLLEVILSSALCSKKPDSWCRTTKKIGTAHVLPISTKASHAPKVFFKRSEDEFLNGCEQIGLKCDTEGYDCFCKPCVRAFDVDVYQYTEGEEDLHLAEHYGEELPGCEKMAICGTVQQGDSITLRIYDNVLRDDATVKVIVHAGDQKRELPVTRIPDTYAYEVIVTDTRVQVQVIEVSVNGDPISQSPIRVEVVDKDCDAIYGESSLREADAEGNCVCENNTYELGNGCVESHFFFLIIFACVFAFLGLLVCFFLSYKKQQSDSVWHVGVEELHFNEPPEVIGQGAFGVVVLGQYRGTKVAVKRVLPPNKIPRNKRGSTAGSIQVSGSLQMVGGASGKKIDEPKKKGKGLEDDEKAVKFDNKKHETDSDGGSRKQISAQMSSHAWEELLFDDNKYGNPLKILESATLSNHGSDSFVMASGSATSQYFLELLPSWMRFDEHARLKREFVNEMRLLSRLRHPCITTVMGAVIAPRVDPMLVMEYMEYGSLYDLLRNETMYAGGEIILQIIRDITQGIQFLHASKPPILHGDLKAKNILVDARFRAKVADFGFSHFKTAKAKNVLQGTPFFMAPEYLRRKSEYTSACDIYSLGMIFYEIYARQDPFEGEDPRKILPKVCHPRVNKRPPVPESCPPKIADIMKKCWSANAFFRPSAKDIDYILVEMNSKEAEPLETIGQEKYKENMRRPTSLYDVFPKHIADALNAGKRVEPESHEIVTVVFSDIVGFTDISQTFTPLKVSCMLDRLYQSFDSLARKHSVFKVETIGDAYMGVTNLDGSQFDTHVKAIAEFATEAIEAAGKILIDEDAPERGTVQIRVGFHSGPVVSNVIGSLNPRYGLFGDTVNTASRMETNSQAGRVHCTYASAKLLETQAPEIPVTLRGKIHVKGKGKMMTYWVGKTDRAKTMDTIQDFSESPSDTDAMEAREAAELLDSLRDLGDAEDDEASVKTKDTEWSSLSGSQPDSQNKTATENTERKIDAVFDVLLSQLKHIVASRPDSAAKRTPLNDQVIKALEKFLGADTTMLEEANEFKYIEIPDGTKTGNERDPDSMALDSVVQQQLHQFVEVVASRHNPNPFHSFDHAVHVAKSANRLIARTNSLAEDATANGEDKTFGLAHDKLAQFAAVFSALIHDLDHKGIPNFCLAKEDPEMNEKFKGKALAEQHSFNMGWDIFMGPEYDALRACVYVNKEELVRFRHLVIKSIIATEIFDPDLAKQRLDRWNEANDSYQSSLVDKDEARNRKATVALEHLIQTSDVAHTMQSWNVYLKWNQNLFRELYIAFKEGRFPHDPAQTWYEGEMKFFDTYLIPLATRLQECEAFGPSSSDYLKYAQKNRRKWEEHGKTVVENMILKIDTDDKLSSKKKRSSNSPPPTEVDPSEIV